MRINGLLTDLDSIQITSGDTQSTYEAYIEPKIFIKNDNNIYEEFTKKQEENYSEQERIIGTWTDGKTLYRKVIKTTMAETSSNGTYANKDVSIDLNIDFGYVEKAILISGTQHMTLPYINNAGHSTKCFIDSSSNLILANGNRTFNNCETYVILEYTKTTD